RLKSFRSFEIFSTKGRDNVKDYANVYHEWDFPKLIPQLPPHMIEYIKACPPMPQISLKTPLLGRPHQMAPSLLLTLKILCCRFKVLQPKCFCLGVEVEMTRGILMTKFASKGNRDIAIPSNMVRQNRWTAPRAEMIKTNCDAAVARNNLNAVCGVITRDCEGNFSWTFTANLGKCDVLQAEMWAIYWGFKISKE
ncbi:hypothetical protein L195_g015703, partial [Trifolium pratense]